MISTFFFIYLLLQFHFFPLIFLPIIFLNLHVLFLIFPFYVLFVSSFSSSWQNIFHTGAEKRHDHFLSFSLSSFLSFVFIYFFHTFTNIGSQFVVNMKKLLSMLAATPRDVWWQRSDTDCHVMRSRDEVWMNLRQSRFASGCCTLFIADALSFQIQLLLTILDLRVVEYTFIRGSRICISNE